MDKWVVDPDTGPIFGYVPEEFRSWYEKNSGTFYKNGKWYVDSNKLLNKDQIEAWINLENKTKNPKPARFFQADEFQNYIGEARETIRNVLDDKKIDYNFGNEEIFALMKNRYVDIKYEYQGFPCVEKISF